MLNDQQQLENFIAMIKYIIIQTEDDNTDATYPIEAAYGMNSTISKQTLNIICKEILSPQYYEQLTNLKPYSDSPIRIKRPAGCKDKLTYLVVRDPAGKYLLAPLAKRKRADGSKRQFLPAKGSNKRAKITYVPWADQPEAYVDLSVNLTYEDQTSFSKMKMKIKNEVYNQNIFHGMDNFAPIIYAGIYQKKITVSNGIEKTIPKAQLLAPYRPTLHDFLSHKWLPTGYSLLSNEQKQAIRQDLGRQLLVILIELHKKDCGYEHKDIKPENLLIKFNNGRLTLQLTDFDLIQRFGTPDIILGTAELRPPWHIYNKIKKAMGDISITIMNFLLNNHDKFKRYSNSYAWHLLCHSLDHIENHAIFELGTAQGKHDIWSAGIVLYTILIIDAFNGFDCMPEQIAQNQILSSMLQLNQHDIPSAIELLQIYDQMYINEHHKQTLLETFVILNAASIIPAYNSKSNNNNKQPDSFISWIEDPRAGFERFKAATQDQQDTLLYNFYNKFTNTLVDPLVQKLREALDAKKYYALSQLADDFISLANNIDRAFNFSQEPQHVRLAHTDDEWYIHLRLMFRLYGTAYLALYKADSESFTKHTTSNMHIMLPMYNNASNIISPLCSKQMVQASKAFDEIMKLSKLILAYRRQDYIGRYQNHLST